jgi:hypothetical protein
VVAVAGDILVQPGDSKVISAAGYSHIAAIRVSEDGVLQVSPIENR